MRLPRSLSAWFVVLASFVQPIPIGSGAAASAPVRGLAELDGQAFRDRRRAALETVPDGIILLHSYSAVKHWEEPAFHQEPGFYYFTGLGNVKGAILALDGTARATWLFVMPKQDWGFGNDLSGLQSVFIEPGNRSQTELGIDHVVPWDQFVTYIDGRRREKPSVAFYIDRGGNTGTMLGTTSNPPGLAPVENMYVLWEHSLRARWPDVTIRDASDAMDALRAVKSPAEIELLRKAAAVTADGFWAGVATIAPGRTQRSIEAEVVRGCLLAGSDMPTFWPWVRSGPFSMPSTHFEAMADYHNMDRTMRAGEVVRVDVGCDFRHYKGDLGRTIPVSGRFDEGQRETMEVLNGAYRAGLSAMRPGATPQQVFRATTEYFVQHQGELKTPLAKEAVAAAAKQERWSLHGLGLDVWERTPNIFRPGHVLCFEPLIAAASQSYFVEDCVLIAPGGPEVLNPPLPYQPEEIETAMRGARSRARH